MADPPELPSIDDIIHVYPMTAPSSLIFFMEYSYGLTPAIDLAFIPVPWECRWKQIIEEIEDDDHEPK